MYPWIILGPVAIPTFFVVNSIVAALAITWITSRAHAKNLPSVFVSNLTLILVLSGLVGARLFHVFYENFDFYKNHPQNVFFLWEGGFVFYGGFISAIVCGWIYARQTKQPKGPYFDLYAPVLSLSYALGRVGCFLAGCCYGKQCDLPWAVQGRHPTQIYSTLWEFGVLSILIGLEKEKRLRSGSIFAIWALLHSAGRFFLEFLRDDFRGMNLGLSISGWISVIIFLIAALWLFTSLKSNRRIISF